MQQRIEQQLILYRSPRHQLGLQTNIKYGLIPHKIKYLPESQRYKKSQETMMKRLGRKYIQVLSYIASIRPKENSRLIYFALKLTSLKKLIHDPPFILNAQKAYDFIRNLTSRIFRRNKYLVNVLTSPMNCLAPLTHYLKPLSLVNSAQRLKFSSFAFSSPGKLTQFYDFLSKSRKRNSWPKLKTFLPEFLINVGQPFLQQTIPKLNDILGIFKDYKSAHLGLRLIFYDEIPPLLADWQIIETILKSPVLSHLQISIRGEIYMKYYNEFLNLFQQKTQLQHIFFVNTGVSNDQENRSLIPIPIGQLSSLLDLSFHLQKVSNPTSLVQTFGVLANLVQLKSLFLNLSKLILDAWSLGVLSDAIFSMKGLNSLRLTLHSITCKSQELDYELTRFCKNLGELTSLKQVDFDWTGLGEKMTREHFQLLCESLRNLPELKVIKLAFSVVYLDSNSLQQLIQVFSKATKLEVLSIKVSIYEVLPENLVNFIESLGSLRNLTDLTLDLYIETLEVDFAKALENSLESLKGLNSIIIGIVQKREDDDVQDRVMECVRRTLKRLKDRMEIFIIDVLTEVS